MKSLQIDPYSIKDIQQQVSKILKGLDNPEPPLNLNSVRELLKLDKQYYSSRDTSTLREFVSKVKVGTKQLALRPSLIVDVIQKAGLKALWIPDRKRILIDAEIPDLKKRHTEAHEIIHSVTPHHSPYLFGDDNETLRYTYHEILEAEANFGSSELLFLQKRFQEEANDLPKDFKSIRYLSSEFGNTITMTLWRLVEQAHKDEPIFGMISAHPIYKSIDFDPENPCRYFIQSPAFRNKFDNITEIEIFNKLSVFLNGHKKGPLGQGEISLKDLNGDSHIFLLESFSNGYDTLTIGNYINPTILNI